MGFIQPGKSLKRRKIAKQSPRSTPVNDFKIQVKCSTNQSLSDKNDKSILERLPQEILFKIFILTRLENNNLPLTSKYFNRLLKFKSIPGSNTLWPNLWLINEFIYNSYTFDLNRKINFNKVEVKLNYYLEKFPADNENENLIKLIKGVEIFKKVSSSLITEFFKFNFMSIDLINYLKTKKFKILNYVQVVEEINERPKFIKSIFKLLSKELKNLSVVSEIASDDHDNLARIADENFNDVMEEENGDDNQIVIGIQYNYKTFEKKPEFPSRFYNNGIESIEKFQLILCLHENFQFNFDKLNLILINSIQNFKTESNLSICEVINFLIDVNESKEKISINSIIELFTLLDDYKVSNNHKLIGELNYCLNKLLLIFYNYEDSTENDHELWLFIINLKNFEFFKTLMKFNDNPSNEILKLMDN